MRKIDLSGQKYGLLTVIEPAEPHRKPSGQIVSMWKCRCDCGNEAIVSLSELRSAGTKSCGCLKRKTTVSSGETFGWLTTISRVDNKRTTWLCQCVCGKQVVRRQDQLNDSSSCGCKRSDMMINMYKTQRRRTNKINIVGRKFGRLTVLEEDPERKNGEVSWICICECGTKTSVTSSRLRKGLTVSCGCFAREQASQQRLIDLTGQTIGKWTVLSRGDDYICRKNGMRCLRWNCKCECGTTRLVFGSVLRNGSSLSCGCSRESNGEKIVANILSMFNIEVQREYTFSDLVSSKGNLLRFDFALFNSNGLVCLIEYQGEQHYETDSSKSFGYSQRTYTDKTKRLYCNERNISLHEIKFDADIENEVIQILNTHNLI